MAPLMKMYNEIFHFLMQVKWAKWSLEELRNRGAGNERGREKERRERWEGEKGGGREWREGRRGGGRGRTGRRGGEGEEGGVESDDSRTRKLMVTDGECLLGV